jgi:nitrogen regulatory protein P-II
MKLAFIVHNQVLATQVMELLESAGIDYYTRWNNVQGKGRGTEPHLGRGSYASTNTVMMIAFDEEAPLQKLIGGIAGANESIKRPSDKIRLFQLPLERII